MAASQCYVVRDVKLLKHFRSHGNQKIILIPVSHRFLIDMGKETRIQVARKITASYHGERCANQRN